MGIQSVMFVAALRLVLAVAPAAAPQAPATVEVDPEIVPGCPQPASVKDGATQSVETGTPSRRGPPTPVAPHPPPPLRAFGAEPETFRPLVELPRQRGIGLFVSGGVLGVVGISFKIAGARANLSLARASDRTGTEIVCFEPCGGFLSNIIATPFLITSAPLLGGGAHMLGRWVSYRDAAMRRPIDRRKTALMIGMGFGAIGVGVASWITGRLTFRKAATNTGEVAIYELGWWTAIASVYGGAGLVGYGSGYRRARRELWLELCDRVAPLLSSELVGVSLSGRF